MSKCQFRSGKGLFLTLFLAGFTVQAQQAVGLVFESQGATIERPGREVRLAAVAGSALFGGDVLHAEGGSLRFSFCSTGTVQTLRGRSLSLDSSGVSLSRAVERGESLKFCRLPVLERLPALPASTRRAAALDGTFASRVQRIPPSRQAALTQELAALDGAIADHSLDPHNSAVQLAAARASLLEDYGLLEDAIASYDAMHERWPEVEWAAHAAIRVVQEADRRGADQALAARGVTSEPLPSGRGSGPVIRKTYAVVVGISQYRIESGIPWLSFADRDAETFARHLEQPRGGGLRRCTGADTSGCEIQILTNASATLANIANVFHSFVQEHAAPDNALIVFLAAHGVDPAMEKDWNGTGGVRKEPMILAYDSDYSETKVSGYAMNQLREEIAEQGLRYGKVVVFVDVCRAGNIGSIAGTSELQPAVRDVFTFRKGAVGLFMASQAQDDAYESSQFGAGHGAFTYSVLHALNPDSPPQRKSLDFDDVLSQVTREVRDLTLDQQVPDGRAVDKRMIVEEDVTLPGLRLDPAYPIGSKKTLRRPRGARPSAPKVARGGAQASPSDSFEEAVSAGRLRRDEGPGSAREALDAISQSTDGARARDYGNRLRVALEDRGQQVILAYLRGDQENQKRAQFENGGRDFAAALELDPRMAFDESRMLFCQGRSLIFPDRANQKDYANAVVLLERAIRLDPNRAYSYNALGIAYLEQVPLNAAFYDLAAAAFHDAIQRAPYWPYPWHNLALTVAERGNYAEAAANYRHGMELAPQYSYLPYSLGLLFQRIHRSEDAEVYYKRAIEVARDAYQQGITPHPAGRKPDEAEANNALGTLAAEAGNRSQARRYYRKAIELDPDSLTARHNLALVLSAKAGRSAEAEALWAENLKHDPRHLATLIARAAYLVREQQWNAAVQDNLAVLALAPEHLSARLQLARAYIASQRPQIALPVLQAAEGQSPAGVAAWIEIGDLYASASDYSDARRAYGKAIEAAQLTSERRLVRSLEKKLESVADKAEAR